MNLVDTSGWIEYFFAGSNTKFFAKPIENIEQLLVPTTCLYEVFKKINQIADEAQALQTIALMKQGTVVPLDEPIALKAALISIRYKLPMANSFIYSTAQAYHATLWTQDVHFKGLANVNFKAPSGPTELN